MEDKNLHSSDFSHFILRQPQLDLEHQDTRERREVDIWSEKELRISPKPPGTDDISLSPDAEQKPVEEEDQSEELWHVRPVNGSGFQISAATVQWDMPEDSAEASSHTTDSWSANGLDYRGAGRVTALDLTSLPVQASENVTAAFLRQEDSHSDLQVSEGPAEPCDAADVQEWKTQEKEECRQRLLDASEAIYRRTGSVKEKEELESSHSVPIPSFKHAIVVISDSEDNRDGFSDLNLEEEREEPRVLLGRLEDVQEEQTPVNSGTSEKTNKRRAGEQREVIVSNNEETYPVSCLRDVTGPAERTQRLGLTRDSLTCPSDEVEMCTGELGAVWSCDEASVQNVGNSQEIPEMTESQEANCAAHTDCNRTTLQEGRGSPQLQHTEERPAQESAQPLQSAELKLLEPSATRPEEPAEMERAACVEEDESRVSEQQELSDRTNEIHDTQLLLQKTELTNSEQGAEDGNKQTMVSNGTAKTLEAEVPHGSRETAQHLAWRLFQLDGIQRADVVKHLDKDNDFSHAVGEEYLKFFDFTGQDLEHALRSFLKVVILIGETQERERVLQHFSCRFYQCNPDSFSSPGSVLSLTCALMLLNTDLHGQNVGKSMSSSKFVSNLDGMNEDGNFSKDLLKSYYNSIKNKPLEWAIGEEELKSSVLLDEGLGEDAPLRSKSNPFQDVPHDRNAPEVKQGFLQRKLHADVDGKRTPWGKRGWKTFYGVLKGMVLYLQKEDYRREQQTSEDVVSVHHSLAEQASDYTKKPHVFRLQTADWRVFLFQASSSVEMNSWIGRINLVSALHSSPPFPAAVGSQRRFHRPILPASQSLHPVNHQLQSHTGMLESFKADLSYHQQNLLNGRKARAKDVGEYRVREGYLQYEVSRYETYIQVLEAWSGLKETDNANLSPADLGLFDKAVCTDTDDESEVGMKKSHSSPSLELETGPSTIVKVKRNISERRTYRRAIVPRWKQENRAKDL